MTFDARISVLLLAGLLSACAGGGTRAPVEERARGGAAPAAAPAAPVGKADAGRRDGVVVEALPEAVSPRLEPLPDETEEPLADDDAATQQLVLAAPAAPARDSATQSLLSAAVQAAALGEWDRAQAALERAVKLSPQDAELWRQLAYTHYREGDLAQAAAHAERAVALAPASAAGWALVADIESARGNEAAAARARRKATVQ